MSPAPKASLDVHESRIESLDEQTSSLRRDSRETHDQIYAIRTDVAVMRERLEVIGRRIDSLLPMPAQVILMLLTVGATALVTYLATHPTSSPIPSAHATTIQH